MLKKSEDFDPQEAMRLAKSPAGQKLLAMLQQGDNGQLQQIMNDFSAGNVDKAGQTLRSLLSSPEAQKLLDALGR